MSDRFFLDTNIFVYSLDERSPSKERKASELIERAVTTRKGFVSFQVVQEFLNVSLKGFVVPITAPDAEQYLNSVFRPLLVVQSSYALLVEALHLCGRYRMSWYDALIVAAAIQAECSTLYTENLHHGLQIGDLRIENPFR